MQGDFIWVISALVCLGTITIAFRFFGFHGSIIALSLLLSYSSFLERGLRIRADLFATLFSLVALGVVCAPTMNRRALFLAGVALGLSFASSQKAVYFVAAFACALMARHLLQSIGGAWERILRDGTSCGLGVQSTSTRACALVLGTGGFNRVYSTNYLLRCLCWA